VTRQYLKFTIFFFVLNIPLAFSNTYNWQPLPLEKQSMRFQAALCDTNGLCLLPTKPQLRQAVYFAIAMGWGTTDWRHLIVHASNPDEFSMVSLSAPIAAHDKGFAYGLVLGYEIRRYFSWEFSYMRFPRARIEFDEVSLYPITEMQTSIYAYNIVGKFSVPITSEHYRGFANAGMAVTHRRDSLAQGAHICPTFGVGMTYFIKINTMMELVFQYYAGYGKAVVRPAISYMPFLYTVHLRVGYRF
jgi:hypothetical protein